MLELQNIYKTYNPSSLQEQKLFKDFSLKIEKGSFVSVVGSNGSGKTSLLNILCGSMGIEHGNILIDGKDITHTKEFIRNRRIGRIHQNPSLGSCAKLTVLENLCLFDAKAKRMNLVPYLNKKRIAYYKDLLAPLGLGLENMLNKACGSLSGGQRQALAIVMATMTDIDFLILDEHTAALDPNASDIIMHLTDKTVRERNLTAVMVTHNLRHAVDYGDRLIMMHSGEIVFDAQGESKSKLKVEDLLGLFNEISIECGN
ncbi:MAG: ATP-binding cassette domain-containing protein [Eubacteriales bacterium]|nr:ATP-binding cassette domain-containing protein [Eubacteriales bacterium]